MIIDSSYLFDLMAEDLDAFAKGAELVENGEMQWLPTPVVAEVYKREQRKYHGPPCPWVKRVKGANF